MPDDESDSSLPVRPHRSIPRDSQREASRRDRDKHGPFVSEKVKSDTSKNEDWEDEDGNLDLATEESASHLNDSDSGTSTEYNTSPSTETESHPVSRRTRTTRKNMTAATESRLATLHQASSASKSTDEFARDLKILETQVDIERLYPPQFSTKSRKVISFSESQILNELISLEAEDAPLTASSEDGDHFSEFDLSDFCIYRSPEHPGGFEGQYESLNVVSSELSQRYWLIDGRLGYDSTSKSFTAAEIVQVGIEGFDNLEEHSTSNLIWVMTAESRKLNYWYRLKSPTKEYLSYWRDFVWLADFTKHFNDYLYEMRTSDRNASLQSFKTDFWIWLRTLHGSKISSWHQQCGNQEDFRNYVLHHSQFLLDQTYSLCTDTHSSKLRHSLWREIGAALHIDQEEIPEEGSDKTAVMPNVANSFRNFSTWKDFDLLETIRASPEVEGWRAKRIAEANLPNKFRYDQSNHFRGDISKAACLLEEAANKDQRIKIHDAKELPRKVVIIREESRKTGQQEFRYAWVRDISKSGVFVVWLVLPLETLCGESSFYPIGNELLFSDRCNCEAVPFRDIVEVLTCSVFTDYAVDADLFVQNIYLEDEGVIANATEANLVCQHGRDHCQTRSSKKRHEALRKKYAKLQCLSIFSGCGLFDNAFTSVGLAETILAIEKWQTAALSWQANNKYPQARHECGCVSVLLKSFLTGEKPLIRPNCIIAGPPCPGFSPLNMYKQNEKGQRNCSLLANTLSWIELFLPEYVLIENVPNMDSGKPNACEQAICHLVALGYKVRKSVKIDSHVGGASSRKRLFIVAALPGFHLPDDLPDTHGSDGLDPTNLLTIRKVISNLGEIDNDMIMNISNPSHIPLERLKVDRRKGVSYRALVRKIPTSPKNMSLSKVYYDQKSLLKPHEREFFEYLHHEQRRRGSKCLMRVDPDRPFRTIATLISPMDARFSGEILHPYEPRTLSLEEVRRAMGAPASFLLVGNMKEQHKQLGNAVPWALGAGWGRQFGNAWIASLSRRESAGGSDVAASSTVSIVQDLQSGSGKTTSTGIVGSPSTAREVRSNLETKSTAKVSVVVTKNIRRELVHEDDIASKAPGQPSRIATKIVRAQVSETTVKEESTVMVESTSASMAERLGSLDPAEVIEISSDEEEKSTPNFRKITKQFPTEKISVRPRVEKESSNSTIDRVRLRSKVARSFGPSPKKRRAPVVYSDDSDDEVPITMKGQVVKREIKKVKE